MNIKFIKVTGSWVDVLNAARNTINKPALEKEPTSEWKRKILLSEHSPIRMLTVYWRWDEMFSWVSQHISRHNKFSEHFVMTGRSDRTGIDRNKLLQSELVNHESFANAQDIIFISRKRLCNKASEETRQAWQKFLTLLKDKEPELVSVCVRECVYRNGLCPEIACCNFNKTDLFKEELKNYLWT